MTAGLYLLAGPFQTERSGVISLVPLWIVLTAYEFTVIGMIHVLRRRGLETTALTVVSVFFLADPIFLGDAVASTDLGASVLLNGLGAALGLVKAWALARARDYRASPWLAGQVAAAICLIHLIPTLIATSAIWPAPNAFLPQAVTWSAAALAVPLARSRWLGGAAIAALAAHFVASAGVGQVDFQPEFLTGPLLATSFLLPWPKFGWMPLPAALYTSPLRTRVDTLFSTLEGIGWMLVAGAFLLLGLGFWRSLRQAPAVEPTRRPPVAPELPRSS